MDVERIGNIEEDEREIIKEYLLENPKTIINIASEVHGWDGSQDWVDVWDIGELAFCIEPIDLARAIIYGHVDNIDDPVRYNVYGNLETVTESDLEIDAKDNVDDVIDDIYDLYPEKISIYDEELLELMNVKEG